MVEAAYTERMQRHPEHSADIVSFVWSGIGIATVAGVPLFLFGAAAFRFGSVFIYLFSVIFFFASDNFFLLTVCLLTPYFQQRIGTDTEYKFSATSEK